MRLPRRPLLGVPANALQFIMPDFGTDQGWQGDKHPRFVVDITGDGIPDIVGFGIAGLYTAVNLGGTFS
jgi:hypothetical protein